MSHNILSHLFFGRRDLSRQFQRYAQTIFWLYGSVLRSRPGTTLLALSTNLLGPVLMGGALAFLVYFAGLMESNTPLDTEFLPVSLDPRDPQIFILVVVISGLTMLVSGLIMFWASCVSIRLATSFARDQSISVLSIDGGRPWRKADPVPGPYPDDVRRCSTGIVVLARAMRPLLQLIQPLVIFLFSMAALIYINPHLTAVMAVIALPSMFFQYRINYSAAKNQEMMGPALRKMQKSIASLLDSLANAPGISPKTAAMLENAYNQEKIRELPERYVIRILARPKSQLVSSMVIAILAVIIVSWLGAGALKGNIAWSLMLGYVIFARTAMFGFSKLLATVTGFARHYLRARRAYELLTSWPGQKRLDAGVIRLRPSNRNNPGDLKSIHFKRGRVIGALSPVPFTRYNTFAWADALTSEDVHREHTWGAMACVPDALFSCPGGSLRELLGMDPDLPAQQVRQAAARLEGGTDLSQADVDAVLDADTWKTLPGIFRCHVLLDMGVRAEADIVMVEHRVLKGAGKKYLENWWTRAAHRFVMVRHTNTDHIGSWGEQTLMAMRTDRETALMSADWAKNNAQALNAWFAQAKTSDTGEDDFDPADDD